MAAPLAAQVDPLVVAAVAASQPEETAREDVAFERCIGPVPREPSQADPGGGFDRSRARAVDQAARASQP